MLSHVWLFVTPMDCIVCQAPLSRVNREYFIFTKLLLFSIFEVSVHFNFIPKVYIIVNIWQFVIECLQTKEVLLFHLMDCVMPDSGSAFYLTFLLNSIHLKSLVTWVTGHHDVIEHKTSKRYITLSDKCRSKY